MRQMLGSSNSLFVNMVFYYAVARGRYPGIYNRWEECKAQVDQFAGPIFKKFHSRAEAEQFIQDRGGPSSTPDTRKEVFAAAAKTVNKPLQSPSKTGVSLPYKELEEKLLNWAAATPKMTQFSVTCEAAKIALSLGIKNFNENGGWLRYHIESNLHVYKELGTNHPKGTASTSEAAEAMLLQRLSALESRFSGLPLSDGSIVGRMKIMRTAVHSINKEFSAISRAFSTDVESSVDVPSSPKRKRAKPNDTISEKNHANLGGNFDVDNEGYVNVYTDGACSSNGRSGAAAGVGVWFANDHPLNISQPVVGRATNNMAEIQAVTMAARQALKSGIKKLKVHTDSQFVISCVTEWMGKWKRNGWRKANGETPINKAELIELEIALAPLEVAWVHVRGHIGIHGNEMADELARAGAGRYRG